MRKKTLFQTIDNLVWFIIALLPLFAYLILNLGDKWIYNPAEEMLDYDKISFTYIMSDFLTIGSSVLTNNAIYRVFSDLFSSSAYGLGGLPSSFIGYITYFCMVQLVHIVVDLLLFVPKIACKWLEKIGGAD